MAILKSHNFEFDEAHIEMRLVDIELKKVPRRDKDKRHRWYKFDTSFHTKANDNLSFGIGSLIHDDLLLLISRIHELVSGSHTEFVFWDLEAYLHINIKKTDTKFFDDRFLVSFWRDLYDKDDAFYPDPDACKIGLKFKENKDCLEEFRLGLVEEYNSINRKYGFETKLV